MLFAALNSIFILINYRSSKNALKTQFFQISRDIEAAFVQEQQATEQRMLQIATFVAADPVVQQLFLAGKEAVAAEGGGGGGIESAKIRQQLYQKVASSREALAARYDFRQLQFHLGPGSLSFLRVHEPEKFGDRMDSVRHTVVAVNLAKQPVSGFETGRVISGIRGVVPVFAQNQQSGAPVYVGALEAGTSYHVTLENITRPRQIGMAILLSVEHLKANMWPGYLDRFFSQNAPIAGLSLEASTDPELWFLMKQGVFPDDSLQLSWRKVDLAGVSNLIIRFPLYDFAGFQDHSRPPVGCVVAKKNVNVLVERFDAGLRTNIFYGLFGFLVTEFLLYISIHLVARKLEGLVTQGRVDLARSLEQLQINEEKFLTMAEYSVDWDVWHGTDGQYLYITPSCEEISGYSRKEFYDSPELFISILHPDDRAKVIEHRQLYYQKPAEAGEISFRIIRKDGEIRWIWHKCQAVFAANGAWRGRRTTNRDVTVLKAVEEQLQKLSTTDPLTGAYNRRMFMDILPREMERTHRYGEAFCLLMFDIDYFKAVNDTYGHDVGDQVLIEIVQLSLEIIRQSDILARWGGEEFMVLLPQTNKEMAFTMGERLRQRIGGHAFPEIDTLTVSVGVSCLTADDTVDKLLKRVDDALYQAKELGRNRVMSG